MCASSDFQAESGKEGNMDIFFGGGEEEQEEAEGWLGTVQGVPESVKVEETSVLMDEFTESNVRHVACVPVEKKDQYVVMQRVEPQKKAREYPFKLDKFQEIAIECIERNESVLVAAHTSAGKTAIAEYAIAFSFMNSQRIIYTSPIKALSNQKYRELDEIFPGKIGLITGDVTLNPTASCIVMTTEIFRSMLYNGGEIVKEMNFVIYDEIHYMRDPERGVVWEESIILAPENMRFVFLSATIENAYEFASWIVYLHSQICHVVYTERRPVPLTHYLVLESGKELYEVCSNNEFDMGEYRNAINAIKMKKTSNTDRKRKQSSDRNDAAKQDHKEGKKKILMKIIDHLKRENILPTIVFAFRRKDCEDYAAVCLSGEDFSPLKEEKDAINLIIQNTLDTLNEEDRMLPQVTNILPYLKRGVGIHHSGFLPIVKELVEILFQEGLVKLLFATETFAMGLNMPASSVIFTEIEKFDGVTRRMLMSSEYIQMSGRSGRRGKDTHGTVIVMLEKEYPNDAMKDMMLGKSCDLNSAFYLSFSMILQFMLIEGINPSNILTQCFYHFQTQKKLKNLEDKIESVNKEKLSAIEELMSMKKEKEIIPEIAEAESTEEKLKEYYAMYNSAACRQIKKHVLYGKVITFFTVLDRKLDTHTAVVLGIERYAVREKIIDNTKKNNAVNVIAEMKKKNKMYRKEICVSFESIIRVSKNAVSAKCIDAFSKEGSSCLKDVVYIDQLDLVEKSPENRELVSKISSLEVKHSERLLLLKNTQIMSAYERVMKLRSKELVLLESFFKQKEIYHLKKFSNMIRVLEELNYCTPEGLVQFKGRVAAVIQVPDSLVLTEMLLDGNFVDLDIDSTVSLLSCFVVEHSDSYSFENLRLSKESKEAYMLLLKKSKNMSITLEKYGLIEHRAKYIEHFSPVLMDVVRAWCEGSSFRAVCSMTEVFEGNIIRCLKRLEEVLKKIVQGARCIGNSDLEKKFSIGIAKIKRDIVFANSLYL